MDFKYTLTTLTLCSIIVTSTLAAVASVIPDHPPLTSSSLPNGDEASSILLSKLRQTSSIETEEQVVSINNNNNDEKIPDKEQRLFFLSSLLAPFLPKPVVPVAAPVGPPQIIIVSQNPTSQGPTTTPAPITTAPATKPPIIIMPQQPALPQTIEVVKPPLFTPIAKPPMLAALEILNVNGPVRLPERIGDTDIYVPNFNQLQGDRLPIPLHLIQNQNLTVGPGQTQIVSVLSNDDIK